MDKIVGSQPAHKNISTTSQRPLGPRSINLDAGNMPGELFLQKGDTLTVQLKTSHQSGPDASHGHWFLDQSDRRLGPMTGETDEGERWSSKEGERLGQRFEWHIPSQESPSETVLRFYFSGNEEEPAGLLTIYVTLLKDPSLWETMHGVRIEAAKSHKKAQRPDKQPNLWATMITARAEGSRPS